MDRENFGNLVSFIECFIDVRHDPDTGGVMPVCSACGADHGEGGAMLLRGGEWYVRCAACLAKEPQDDLQTYTVAEFIALAYNKYGRKAGTEPNDGGLARIDIGELVARAE
jgi:hypothetical protein